ncbi:hypothetical protein X727_12805 [Mesorhizobium sp. L103C119B0]|uniref:phosphoribosyltransferase-like protein n=1 Tax=Mesorhizobium sp. L103C119B0 TaxID=1287085 RepID=UPI0003D063B2|nr:hypothetical protein [Mesorhizobium sp. L103C119B0]ESZ70684.1 hypothetical protein X727_12805 [Mesorhizobium sp. L103C119B0]
MDPADFKVLLDICDSCRWIKSEYEALVRLWNDCSDDDARELIVDLIKRFKVLTSFEMTDITKSISRHVQDTWSLSAKNTLFFAVSDDYESDGSQAFLQQLKNDFSPAAGWQEKNFRNSLKGYEAAFGNGKNYILFDDFFGTGRTMERQANKFIEYVAASGFQDNKIYLLAIAGMNSAKARLDELGLAYHSEVWLDRGISDIYDEDVVDSKRKLMKSLEKILGSRYNGQFLPSMGYGVFRSTFFNSQLQLP